MIHSADFTGDIPEFVVKANSVTQPLCIDTMRQHIKQNRTFLGHIVDDVRATCAFISFVSSSSCIYLFRILIVIELIFGTILRTSSPRCTQIQSKQDMLKQIAAARAGAEAIAASTLQANVASASAGETLPIRDAARRTVCSRLCVVS